MGKYKKVSTILEKTAETLEIRGWNQGAWNSQSHCTNLSQCLEGGMETVLGIEHGVLGKSTVAVGDKKLRLKEHPAYKFLKKFIKDNHDDVGYNWGSLYEWNDKSGRKKSQVLQVLHDAAQAAKTEEAKERYQAKSKDKAKAQQKMYEAMAEHFNEELDKVGDIVVPDDLSALVPDDISSITEVSDA